MPQGTKINIVEQHVEKAVLALCTLLVIYGVVHWGIASPRKIKVYGGQPPKRLTIAPSDVDGAIGQAAEAVDEKAKEEPVRIGRPRNYLADIQAARTDPFGVDLQNVVAWSQPPAPVARREFARGTYITLQKLQDEMPSPPKPDLVVVRSLTRRPGDDEDRPEPVIVAHLWAQYPWEKLTAAWETMLKKAATSTRVVVVAVELESRYLGPDGKWLIGEARTVPAKTLELPAFTGDNGGEIATAIATLRDKLQDGILRPGYWQVYTPASTTWVDWAKRLARPLPEQTDTLLWAHEDELMVERPYAYRYRLVLVNPLLASAVDVDDAHRQDAATPLAFSGWSPWSDSAAAAPVTEFFMRSASSQGFVRVEVFTDAMGKTVQEQFRTELGEPIGAEITKDVTNPITGRSEPMSVDFRTGKLVVALGGGRQVLVKNFLRSTTAVILLDSQGKLQIRLVQLDLAKLKQRK